MSRTGIHKLSILLAVFALILCACTTNARVAPPPTISLSLIPHQGHEFNYINTHQLIIETSDLNINGLLFSAQPPPLSSPNLSTKAAESKWEFFGSWVDDDVAEYDAIAADSIVYCVDQRVNTTWAGIEFFSDEQGHSHTFKLTPIDTNRFDQIYNDEHGYGSFSLSCPIRFIAPTPEGSALPDITNIRVETTRGQPIKVDIELRPKQSIISTSEIVLNSAKMAHGDENSPFSASTLTIDLRTNSTGYLDIVLDNGPTFYPASYSTGKPAEFYCLVGGSIHSTIARLIYVSSTLVRLHIIDKTNEQIGCNLTTRYEYNYITAPDQPMLVSVGTGAETLIARVEQTLHPASYRVNVQSFDKTDLGLIIVGISTTQQSSTPLLADSTVEYRFNKEFKVKNFVLDEDQIGIQKFTCLGLDKKANYIGTVSIENNSIFVRDIITKANNPSTTCVMNFHGEDTINFNTTNAMAGGTVQVFVDDEQLSGHYSLHSNLEPFFIPAKYNFEINTKSTPLDTSAVENNQGMVDVEMEYEFKITNLDPESFTRPHKPHLVFSLGGPLPFTHEEMGEQITQCTTNTPENNTPILIGARFNKEMLAWDIDLTTILQNIPIFDISVNCKRIAYTMKPRYGLDIRPKVTVTGQIVDLIDNHRYVKGANSSPVVTQGEQSIPQPTIPPSDDKIPLNQSQFFGLRGSVEIPSLPVYEDYINGYNAADGSTINLFTTTMNNLRRDINKGLDQTLEIAPGYPILTLLTGDQGTSARMDMNSGADLYKISTKKSTYAPFQIDPPEPFVAAAYEPDDPFQSLYFRNTVEFILLLSTKKPIDTSNESNFHREIKPLMRLDWSHQYIDAGLPFPIQDVGTTYTTVQFPIFSTFIYSDVETCGWDQGVRISGRLTQDLSNFTPLVWKEYSTKWNSDSTVLCPLNAQCRISADCQQNNGLTMCSNGICSLVPMKLSPYVDYINVGPQFYKNHYSFEKPGPIVWVAIFGILFFLLFSAVLFACQKQPGENMTTPSQQANPQSQDEYRQVLLN